MFLQQLILIFHILLAIILICIILVQQSKGSMGSSFGAGASQTVFGSRGSSSFLLKLTFLIATLFLVTSVVLTYLSHHAMTMNQQSTTTLLNTANIKKSAVKSSPLVNGSMNTSKKSVATTKKSGDH